MSDKTLVIGLDAATWDMIDPLRNQDKLPNIDELIRRGSSGTLESTTPPMTPLAWTSMATGVNPGKHGIYDFVKQDKDNYQIKPIKYSDMPRPAIWDLLNAEGQTAGVINFPMANPPESIDEFFISGIPAPDTADIAHPPEIQRYIERNNFRIHPRVSKDEPQQYFTEISEMTDAQYELTLALAKDHDLDLLWTVFMGLDWAQHYLWDETIDGENAVERLYEQIDRVVGRLTEALNDRNVLLVSDHGAGPIDGEIHLNTLLAEWGYLSEDDSNQSILKRISNATANAAWQIGRKLPSSGKQIIRQHFPQILFRDIQQRAGIGQYDMHKSIDWERTTAFSYGAMGRVFLHTEDEYPDGTVAENEIEQLREEIIKRLEGLSHPKTGQQLVEWAARSSEIYDGNLVNEGPDILFATTNWRYMVYCDFGDEWIHSPRERVADHRPKGMYIFAGNNIEHGTFDAAVTDVTPTLLHLHGLPVLEGMDGRVLTEILSTDSQIEIISDYEKENRIGDKIRDGEIEERLKDLGYL